MKLWLAAGMIAGALVFCGDGAAAKRVKTEAHTPTAALGRFVAQDDIGDVYSEVTVNLKKETIHVDGKKSNLQKILGVSEKKEEKILDVTAAKAVDYVESSTVCEAEKISANEIVITNDFQTHRLIATVEEIEETYGAVEAVKGITAYILKYESEEATKEAYDKLVEEYGEDKIFPDKIYQMEEVQCASDTVKLAGDFREVKEDEEQDEGIAGGQQDSAASALSYTSGGYVDTAKTMGLYSINEQINRSKYANNKVTVAVLDSGLTYTINPSCEIGRKLRDKRKEEWMYAFDGTADAGDSNGHGTKVCSVIAYNTPDNVQYCMFKIMDSEGVIFDASIFAALEQAYILDIDVVNCSFGEVNPLGKESTKKYDAILKKLYEKGTIVCCAAGNDTNHHYKKDKNKNVIDEYDTSADCVIPANSDYVLCISALEATSNGLFVRSSFTNTGKTVDYSAIGKDVYVYTNESKEEGVSGTSLSTPLVAAEFAILKTCNDSYISVDRMREFYDLFLNSASKTADSTIYGEGYFDLSNVGLCTQNHSRCCGLWHYNGTTSDIGKTHTLTINLNGGTGYGHTGTSTIGKSSKFTRTFTCGTEFHFASAYGLQTTNSNGWFQFGETAKAGSGTVTDPYTPYREGYMFVGWKCSGYGSVHKKISYISGKYTEIWCYNGEDNGNVTLTAQWMPKNLYNVLTVVPNGGSMYNGDTITTQPFNINYKIGKYRILCNSSSPRSHAGKAIGEPIREGYTFAGWDIVYGQGKVSKIISQSAYLTNEFYGQSDSTYGYAYYSDSYNEEEAYIKACWEGNKYRVYLNVDATKTLLSSMVTYGREYGSILKCVPKKDGYTFDGWYTALNGGKKVTVSTTVTTTSNHYLYAHWK